MMAIFLIMLTYPQDHTLKPLDGNLNSEVVDEVNEEKTNDSEK
jgi:hypothetical protein